MWLDKKVNIQIILANILLPLTANAKMLSAILYTAALVDNLRQTNHAPDLATNVEVSSPQ